MTSAGAANLGTPLKGSRDVSHGIRGHRLPETRESQPWNKSRDLRTAPIRRARVLVGLRYEPSFIHLRTILVPSFIRTAPGSGAGSFMRESCKWYPVSASGGAAVRV